MAKTKSNIMVRTLTALIMAPIAIAGLYFGYPYVVLMLLGIGALLSWEWSTMTSNEKPTIYAIIYTVSMSVAVMLNSWLGIGIALLFCTLLVCFKSKGEQHRGLLILGVPYVTLGIGSLMWIYYITAFHILCFVLMIWATDIGGYVFGKTIKGPKLAPKISPNKTWAGLVGGVLLAAAVSFAYTSWWQINYNWEFAAAAAVVAVVSQIGDLAESKIKRIAGVKDSSNLIPGHGGVFDRMDGLMFAAPFVFAAFVVLFYVKLGM